MKDLIEPAKSAIVRRSEAYTGELREATPDFNLLFTKLKRRIVPIVIVVLLVLIPAGVATYFETPLYRSAVLIQVTPDPVQIMPYRDVADASGSAYYDSYMATQDQALRGPSLAKRVSARLKTEADGSAMKAEAAHVVARYAVRRIPNSQLFEISYLAPWPDVAARVVNIFAEEYIKQQLELRRATREKARDSLQKELETLERRVQASEQTLASYARGKNMVSATPGQGDLVQTRLALLDQQAAAAEADVITARTRLDGLQKASESQFPERLITPVITALTQQLLQQQQELLNLRARFGENWPAVVAKRGEVNLLTQQLKGEKTAALAQSREQADLDLRVAEGRRAAIVRALDEQKDSVDRYNTALIQYNILRREVETSQKLYEGVLERLRQTSVQGGLTFGNVQVLEPGVPEERAVSPRVAWNLSIASMLGLCLGIGLAFVLEYVDDSVGSQDDLVETTQLPLLGSMPFTKVLPQARSVHKERLPAPSVQVLGISKELAKAFLPRPEELIESVRAICASILLSQADRKLQVIAITSAVPAEGKTTVVCELAQALAESGAETLVVESDLRAPGVCRFFGIDSQDGLSLFLSGHTPTPTIHKTQQPKLSVVSAGPKPPNPVALLNSERMRAFVRDASGSFRFVLLDSPPVLAVADARVLGALADGVILVVRAQQTSKHLLRRAQSALQDSGLNTLGTVLNGAKDPMQRYYSRYYR